MKENNYTKIMEAQKYNYQDRDLLMNKILRI